MKRVKWTAKGKNVWTVRDFQLHPDGHAIEVAVSNPSTKFVMYLREEFAPDYWKSISEIKKTRAIEHLKQQIRAHPDYISTKRFTQQRGAKYEYHKRQERKSNRRRD
jgi:hypothetical protein